MSTTTTVTTSNQTKKISSISTIAIIGAYVGGSLLVGLMMRPKYRPHKNTENTKEQEKNKGQEEQEGQEGQEEQNVATVPIEAAIKTRNGKSTQLETMTTRITKHRYEPDKSRNIVVRSYYNVKNYIYDAFTNDEDELVLKPEYAGNALGKMLLKYENMSFLKLMGIHCGLGCLLGLTKGLKKNSVLKENYKSLWKGAVVLGGIGAVSGVILDVIGESFIIARAIITYDPKTTSRFKSRSSVITIAFPLFSMANSIRDPNSDMRQVVGWFV